MTLTLNLTPDIGTASVLIEVTENLSDVSRFTLTRTDANGVASVRRLAGQTISGGSMTVRDSEPALSGPVTYTVANGGAAVSSTVTLDVSRDVLAVPVLPQFRANSEVTSEYTATRQSRSVIHEPIGRPDPVVSIAPLGLRTGTVAYKVATREEAQALTSVYERGEVLFLRFAEAVVPDIYHVANSVEADFDLEFRSWTVRVDYTEVRRPSTALRGALGWSFNNVSAMSFLVVKARFATFQDLSTGVSA